MPHGGGEGLGAEGEHEAVSHNGTLPYSAFWQGRIFIAVGVLPVGGGRVEFFIGFPNPRDGNHAGEASAAGGRGFVLDI